MTVEYDLGMQGEPGPPPPPVAPPDPALARRLRRRRGRAAALLLAGVVTALGLFAVPALAQQAARPVGAGYPGLPDHWSAAPAGSPLVRDWPMTAASMLLRARDGSWSVISADGNRYARLGLTERDLFPALSDDGTLVAWLSVGGPGAGQVHVLRLVDGRTIATTLHVAGFVPIALRWNLNSVEVSAWTDVQPSAEVPDPEPTSTPSARWVPGARQVLCLLTPVLSTPERLIPVGVLNGLPCDGTPAQTVVPPARATDVEPYGTVWERESGSNASLTRAADGRPTLRVLRAARTALPTTRTHPLFGGAPGREVTSARLLAWTAAGLAVQVETTDGRSGAGELRLISPDTLAERVVSRSGPDAAGTRPVAVAPAAVGTGQAAPVAAPSYPVWRPASIASLSRRVQADLPAVTFVALAVPLLLLGAGLAMLNPDVGGTGTGT